VFNIANHVAASDCVGRLSRPWILSIGHSVYGNETIVLFQGRNRMEPVAQFSAHRSYTPLRNFNSTFPDTDKLNRTKLLGGLRGIPAHPPYSSI
jgi:hypothetical protein